MWWQWDAPEPRQRLGDAERESEATYLERHGLLLPGERRRLTAEDFEPELVV